MKKIFRSVVFLLAFALPPVLRASHLLDDCSNAASWKSSGSAPEVVTDGGSKALKVTLPGRTFRRGLSNVSGNPHLNHMKGISLEVKGDGSDFYMPMVLNGFGSNHGWNYTYYVPVKGSDWQTVTVGFDRFTAASGSSYWQFNMPGAFGAGGIDGITFGDRWKIGHCNRTLEQRTVLIRNIRLVSKVEPYVLKPFPVRKVSDVVSRMKAGKKVNIICAGDSITAGTCVENGDLNRYGVKLQNKLRKAFGNDDIHVEVVAVGGAKTFDLRVWAERDFAGKKVDLVTILIGYNDKSLSYSTAYYRDSLSLAIDRILNVTGGQPAILLLPPIPGQGARFNMLDDYAESCKRVARERGLDFFEMAPSFRKLPPETFGSYFADMAHPNAAGHEFMAQLLAEYLTGK